MQNYGSIPSTPIERPRSRRRPIKWAIAAVAAFAAVAMVSSMALAIQQDEIDREVLASVRISDLTNTATNFSSIRSSGGVSNIACADATKYLNNYTLEFAGLWMKAHEGCHHELAATGGCPNADFKCESAMVQELSTVSLWLRGTCGGAGPVIIYHIAHPPEYVASRQNPVAGSEDTSDHLHTGPLPAVDKNGTAEYHRDRLEHLQNHLQVLECHKVADSLAALHIHGDTILSINEANLGWKAALDPEFAKLSREEFRRTKLGLVVPPKSEQNAPILTGSMLTATPLPSSYNFSMTYSTCKSTEIRNQMSCGSCYAFAAAKAMSNSLCQSSQGRYNVQLSEQQVISCYSNANGCGGGWGPEVFSESKKDGGYSTRHCLPYQGTDADDAGGVQCNAACSNDLKYQAVTFNKVEANADVIRRAIIEKGTLWIGMKTVDSFSSYSSGIFTPTEALSAYPGDIDHAVALVGYGPGYWLIANSWGAKWGEYGYARMATGAKCMLDLDTAYSVDVSTAGPSCPAADRCINGGTFNADCSCWCPSGYGGPTCATCTRTCQHGGVLNAATCECACPVGYFGENCAGQFTARFSAYDPSTVKAAFTFHWNLDFFEAATSPPMVNTIRRFTNPYFNQSGSGCASVAVTGKTGTATLSDIAMYMGFGGPDFEHCYGVELSLGKNEFGRSKGTVLVKFPCFYLKTATNGNYPGGRCLSGGHHVINQTSPVYHMQCHTPAPPTPAPSSTNVVNGCITLDTSNCIVHSACPGTGNHAVKCNLNGGTRTLTINMPKVYDFNAKPYANTCESCAVV